MGGLEMKAATENKMSDTKNSLPSKGDRAFDLSSPEWYLNRELTWLEFNRRVFNESKDERNPLLERVFFLAVIGSNLDEFFMKRIGGLKQQVGAGLKLLSFDGRTPRQQIDESYGMVRDILEKQQNLERELLAQLAKQDIEIVQYTALNEQQRQKMADLFP